MVGAREGCDHAFVALNFGIELQGVRETCPGGGVIGVELNRLSGNADNDFISANVTVIAANPVLARHEVEIVRLDVRGPAVFDRLLFLGQQLDLQRGNDRFGNLVLDRKDIGQFAVVAVGPDLIAGFGVDQLRIDPHPVSSLADAAFQDMRDVQLARNLPRLERLALQCEGGIPGRN